MIQQHRAIAFPLESFVDHQILEQENEAAFRCADGEEQVDHPDDRPILPQHEDTAAIWLLEDQPQRVQLLVSIRPEVALFAEKLAKQDRQLVQVFEGGGLDNDIAHGGLPLFHNRAAVAMRIPRARS